MTNKIIAKLKCETPGCGFIGDLLDNNRAFDDIADKTPCEMFRNPDGSFVCLACGAPIYPLMTLKETGEVCRVFDVQNYVSGWGIPVTLIRISDDEKQHCTSLDSFVEVDKHE